MATVELPQTLARTIEVGKEEAMRPGFLEFETDSGATTKNKMPGTQLDDVQWSIFCNREQRDHWKNFYRYACRGGTDAISYFGDTYNWVTGPAFKEVTGLMYRGAIVLTRE
ncbi:MAG: hypothetical protein C4583_03085 [Anaerolineaceae bacterium]|nr:MAG: hypothetical protein C4583_03085 [Anaerolineaceae bacterium]